MAFANTIHQKRERGSLALGDFLYHRPDLVALAEQDVSPGDWCGEAAALALLRRAYPEPTTEEEPKS